MDFKWAIVGGVLGLVTGGAATLVFQVGREPPAAAAVADTTEQAPAAGSVERISSLAPRPESLQYDEAIRERAHEHERAAERLIAKNEARWHGDQSAPVQGAKMEQALLAAMTSDGVVTARFQPDTFDVKCKSSMCRIESRFPQGADGNEWATRMLLAMEGQIATGESAVETLPEGGQKLVLYGYRAGRAPMR